MGTAQSRPRYSEQRTDSGVSQDSDIGQSASGEPSTPPKPRKIVSFEENVETVEPTWYEENTSEYGTQEETICTSSGDMPLTCAGLNLHDFECDCGLPCGLVMSSPSQTGIPHHLVHNHNGTPITDSSLSCISTPSSSNGETTPGSIDSGAQLYPCHNRLRLNSESKTKTDLWTNASDDLKCKKVLKLYAPVNQSSQIFVKAWQANQNVSRRTYGLSHVPSTCSSVPANKSYYSPFDKLDDFFIVKIFSFLNTNYICKCAQVCRRWYFLAWDPQLWCSVMLSGESVQMDYALKMIIRRLSRETPNVCLTIEKLYITRGTKLSDRGLYLVAKWCPELRYLQLKYCHHITNAVIFDLVSRCINLRHLELTGCSQITCIQLSPDFQEEFIYDHQIYLQYLDMSECQDLQDSGLRVIARHCTQLKHLYLRRCIQITDFGLRFIANYCSSLHELSLSDCTLVTDFALYELAKLGPCLKYLSVAKCDRISDAGVKQIARHCYKLRYLNVRGCEAVSDDSMEMLAKYCLRLRHLDIGKCDITDRGLKLLSKNCPNLRKLSVRSCDMITDKGVQYVGYFCRGLQLLSIQNCQLTVESYRTVKRFCKRCIIEHTNPGFF